jgi:hypothetical protein
MLFAAASCALAAAEPDAESFFELKVRPLLVAHCAKCHGADKQSSGLRVDSRDALTQGGDRGPAIVPGKPEQSLLVEAVRRSGELKMPPDERLPDEAVADLVTWIGAGAVWPARAATDIAFDSARHWAFRPVEAAALPADTSGSSEHPIDRFIAAGLHEKGLNPLARAAKPALLRRAYFDLVGLPPTADDLAAFVADEAPDAFARVVERLLASPAYGERWGRHWLDVARYADTAGDNADYPVPELHLYRDYVIAAFNADKPYDQFVREQLAGDILAAAGPAERYAEQVIATGFLALSRRYGTMPQELWHLTIEDTIDVTGQALLGLTLRCARCHDHKFDPVTTQDYYALYGIFASTRYAYAGSEEYQSKGKNRTGFVPLVPPAEAAPRLAAHAQEIDAAQAALDEAEKNGPAVARLAQLKGQIEALSQRIKDATPEEPQAPEWKKELSGLEKDSKETKRQFDARLKELRDALRDLQRSGLPADLVGAYAVSEGEPCDVPIQRRGEPADAGPIAKRHAPKFLRSADLAIPAGASGRQQLAEWIVRGDNPLAARVITNRIWQWHFGKGIVDTPSNFGLRGQAPTHPALLDWLAHEFVTSGWSVKAMHRLIMSSQTYQLAAAADPSGASAQQAALAVDPDNRLYWRFDRRRLEAEALRDAMLAMGGTLDLAPAAAHPFPPLNQWNWTQHSPFKTIYPSTKRSVYLMTPRIQRHPYLGLFDGPDANYSTATRTEATVPSQALFFLNNPLLAEQARGFARRLSEQYSAPQVRVAGAILQAWGRAAEADEVARVLDYLAAVRQELERSGCAPEELELESWASYARVLLSANEFLYVD